MRIPFVGSKYSVAEDLYPYFQDGRRYVEPFCGGCNMFFHVFERGDFDEYLLNDVYSYELLAAIRDFNDWDNLPLEANEALYDDLRINNRTTIATLLAPYITYDGSYYIQYINNYDCYSVIDNYQAIQNILRLDNVRLNNLSYKYLDFMEDDFVYLDPPCYNPSNQYSMDHNEFLIWLLEQNFNWALSGYPNTLYDYFVGLPVVKFIDKKEHLWIG